MTEAPDIDLERLAAANPVSGSELRADERASDRASLRRSAIRSSRRARPSRPGLRIGGAIAGLAAVGGLAAALVISPGGASHPGFAAAAVKVAEANPRLLVTAPAWHVTEADNFTATDGDMYFSDGSHELELNWQPAKGYDSTIRDRLATVDRHPASVKVLGMNALVFAYSPTDLATYLEPQGSVFVEIRGDLGSRQAYLNAVQSLRSVDVESWLAAMPASVVQPDDRNATIDSMMADIPAPPGLNLDPIRNQAGVLSRYQLGAAVTDAVTCGWLERWDEAQASGDVQEADQAVKAMATSHSWAILQEMQQTGYLPHILWEFADGIANGHLDRSNANSALECNLKP